MADEQYCAPLPGNILHLPEAFLLDFHVAHGQDFIHHEYLRFQVRRYSKRQAHIHATAVAFDWSFKEPIHARECHDLVKFAFDLGTRHSKDGAVQKNVLPSRQFWMKARAHLQQAGHTTAQVDQLAVSTTDGPATVSGVAVALSKCGTTVRDLTLRSPTLDDVFLELTGARFEHEDDREATR
jgi:hypothetical protein